MRKTCPIVLIATMVAGLGVTLAPALAKEPTQPIDQISNPTGYSYGDIAITPDQMHEPFVRDGVVIEPQRFQSVSRGLQSADVLTLLGNPLRKTGREWEYNFKLRMTNSQNFLVCQYKVVFDQNDAISSTAWRRRQCEQLVKG